MELHSILSLCRFENKVRWPVGFPFFRSNKSSEQKNDRNKLDSKNNEKILLQCSGCGLTGIDGDAMCRHILNAITFQTDNLLQNTDNDRVSTSEINHSCANAVVYTSDILEEGNFF